MSQLAAWLDGLCLGHVYGLVKEMVSCAKSLPDSHQGSA